MNLGSHECFSFAILVSLQSSLKLMKVGNIVRNSQVEIGAVWNFENKNVCRVVSCLPEVMADVSTALNQL